MKKEEIRVRCWRNGQVEEYWVFKSQDWRKAEACYDEMVAKREYDDVDMVTATRILED